MRDKVVRTGGFTSSLSPMGAALRIGRFLRTRYSKSFHIFGPHWPWPIVLASDDKLKGPHSTGQRASRGGEGFAQSELERI